MAPLVRARGDITFGMNTFTHCTHVVTAQNLAEPNARPDADCAPVSTDKRTYLDPFELVAIMHCRDRASSPGAPQKNGTAGSGSI